MGTGGANENGPIPGASRQLGAPPALMQGPQLGMAVAHVTASPPACADFLPETWRLAAVCVCDHGAKVPLSSWDHRHEAPARWPSPALWGAWLHVVCECCSQPGLPTDTHEGQGQEGACGWSHTWGHRPGRDELSLAPR